MKENNKSKREREREREEREGRRLLSKVPFGELVWQTERVSDAGYKDGGRERLKRD